MYKTPDWLVDNVDEVEITTEDISSDPLDDISGTPAAGHEGSADITMNSLEISLPSPVPVTSADVSALSTPIRPSVQGGYLAVTPPPPPPIFGAVPQVSFLCYFTLFSTLTYDCVLY